jgi:sialate O-acetylesterase
MIKRREWLCGLTAGLLLALNGVCRGQDNPVVSKLFSDHMVLQREMPVPVWGTAKPGTKVTVKFAQQEKTAEADKDGKWLLRLDALKVSAEPAALTVKFVAGDKPVIMSIADVLVGDVWLCSGQSNMEWGMKQFKTEEDVAKADFPKIRQTRFGNGWVVCSPQTAGDFSATSFYFGRRIFQETGVPVGLLYDAVGATTIERWIPMEGFKASKELKEDEIKRVAEFHKNLSGKIPELAAWLETAKASMAADKTFPHIPIMPTFENVGYGQLFAELTRPLIPFALKGMIWYQGEANGIEGDIYMHKMIALITGLRNVWAQGDFPVYFVQLPQFRESNNSPEGGDLWATSRMAQFKSLKIPKTGMAVTIDFGEAGNTHPDNKFDTGNRLALWALAKDYGRKDLVYSGPLYKGMKVEGSRIRLAFDYVGKGLMVGSKKGRDPVQQDPGGKLKQFAIAAADPAAPKGLKWFWAGAVIDGDTVVVSCPEVQQPVAVHYAYSSNPEGCNLYNKDGLPASPFRTEK